MPEAKFRLVIRCFAFDLTTTKTAPLVGLPLRSVNTIFFRVRQHHSRFHRLNDLAMEETSH